MKRILLLTLIVFTPALVNAAPESVPELPSPLTGQEGSEARLEYKMCQSLDCMCSSFLPPLWVPGGLLYDLYCNPATAGQPTCATPLGDVNFNLTVSLEDVEIVTGQIADGVYSYHSDLNRDGVLNIRDLTIVNSLLGDIVCSLDPDLDSDGQTDFSDVLILLNSWGSRGSAADLDKDQTVGGEDLQILLNFWSTMN